LSCPFNTLNPTQNGNLESKEENGWTYATKLEQEYFYDQQHYCYIKPRTPSRNTNVLKFTVVDTSLANGKTTKVRELRSFPYGVMNNFTTGRTVSKPGKKKHQNEREREREAKKLHRKYGGFGWWPLTDSGVCFRQISIGQLGLAEKVVGFFGQIHWGGGVFCPFALFFGIKSDVFMCQYFIGGCKS
jgi:hypothetical protein